MKVFRIVMVLLLSAAVVVGIVFATIMQPKRTCTGYECRLHYQGQYPCLSDSDVYRIINRQCPDIIDSRLKDVNLEQVTEQLRQNPYIKSIDELRFVGTKMRISLTLKNVILHVYTQNGDQYFVDETGEMLPFSMSVKENVFIVNGKINDKFVCGKNIAHAKGNLAMAFQIAESLLQNDFYTAQFRQIYVNQDNEAILVPTVGRHVVLFGTQEQAEDKLFNLQQTYQQGLAYMGMDNYSMLDVRYKNRVIAKKRQTAI